MTEVSEVLEVRSFEAELQRAFENVVWTHSQRIPFTKAGFWQLMALSEPYLRAGWRSRFDVRYAEPTQEQLIRSTLPVPEVAIRREEEGS